MKFEIPNHKKLLILIVVIFYSCYLQLQCKNSQRMEQSKHEEQLQMIEMWTLSMPRMARERIQRGIFMKKGSNVYQFAFS